MGNGREWNIKDRHTERQTDTQKDRQTTPTQKDGEIDKEHTQKDRQTTPTQKDGQKDKQTDTQTHTQTVANR